MEYCEKSTLRDMINEGVYMSGEKVGRHFREIVEGLAHVHSQVSDFFVINVCVKGFQLSFTAL